MGHSSGSFCPSSSPPWMVSASSTHCGLVVYCPGGYKLGKPLKLCTECLNVFLGDKLILKRLQDPQIIKESLRTRRSCNITVRHFVSDIDLPGL